MLLKRDPDWPRWKHEPPPDDEVLGRCEVEDLLARIGGQPPDLAIGGDMMLGGRATESVQAYGPDYPLEAVAPLLSSCGFGLANHEAPFAIRAMNQPRRYSYRVEPAMIPALQRAGIRAVTLANNHVMDCGVEGIDETIQAVDEAGLARVGLGRSESEARAPLIVQGGRWRIGMLGYHDSRRCAASGSRPGCARGDLAQLREDIGRLRPLVDRVVVTFHWGLTYEREPVERQRARAHRAIESGADLVVGHHPHILQPYEVYAGRPILYSVGNLAFGSGNSSAEGLLVRVTFVEHGLECQLFPLYVRNRDPRVNYQTRVLGGASAERTLAALSQASRGYGPGLELRQGTGCLRV